jgi:prepilin-type processing-associated H-X9-DG protein/prepilin-type N-terminal cleavage/methylation domain-containing protein
VCRRAFTLIELLVVISIISILSGLLMPALTRALAEAHSAACRSNLANIGKAVLMFEADHNQYLPDLGDYEGRWFFGTRTGPLEPVDFSSGVLSGYLGATGDIWQCPMFGRGEFVPRALGPTTGYAYNYQYLTSLVEEGNWWDPDYKYWWKGLSVTIIAKPVTTVLFGDSATNRMGPLEENWFWTPPSQALPWGLAYTHFRHDGRANVLWADGHVTSLPPSGAADLDKDDLGVICDEGDAYFDPNQ